MGVSILSNVIDDIEERADIDDYEFIFVTVDPDRDTPNRLNDFLSNFNEKIVGLTGEYESLKPVWENFFVHVKSNMIPEQDSNSELDNSKIQNSHEDHDSHDSHGDHQANNDKEDSNNNYIVQHSAFYFIFDRKDNLKTILPYGSSSEEILVELSNL